LRILKFEDLSIKHGTLKLVTPIPKPETLNFELETLKA